MPLGARFPGTGGVLPGRLGREREDRDGGWVGGLSFGVAADETDKGDSIEVHTVLLVLPVCLGHPKASGHGSPDKKLLFWGDRNGVCLEASFGRGGQLILPRQGLKKLTGRQSEEAVRVFNESGSALLATGCFKLRTSGQ